MAQLALTYRTQRQYQSAWHRFKAWCADRGVTAMPASPELVKVYRSEAACSVSDGTLRVWMVAINQAHHAAGHNPPMPSAPARSAGGRAKRANRLSKLDPSTNRPFH